MDSSSLGLMGMISMFLSLHVDWNSGIVKETDSLPMLCFIAISHRDAMLTQRFSSVSIISLALLESSFLFAKLKSSALVSSRYVTDTP